MPAAQTIPVTSNIEIDNLKAKIAAVKADIRQEQGLCEGVPSEQLEVQLEWSDRKNRRVEMHAQTAAIFRNALYFEPSSVRTLYRYILNKNRNVNGTIKFSNFCGGNEGQKLTLSKFIKL